MKFLKCPNSFLHQYKKMVGRCIVLSQESGRECRKRIGTNHYTCRRHRKHEATFQLWERLKTVPVGVLRIIGSFRVTPPFSEMWQGNTTDEIFWINYNLARKMTLKYYGKSVFARFY